MQRIYKYKITNGPKHSIGVSTTIPMPCECKIIAVGVQAGEIVVWGEVTPDSMNVTVEFFIVWTGDSVPRGVYRGTVTIDGLVYHVYGGHQA